MPEKKKVDKDAICPINVMSYIYNQLNNIDPKNVNNIDPRNVLNLEKC